MQVKLYLENHNGNIRGGTWFRTRKGVLIGRGVPSKVFRGEEVEVPLEKWQDVAFRKDVHSTIRFLGKQWVLRVEIVDGVATPDTSKEVEQLKKELAEEKAKTANLQHQIDVVIGGEPLPRSTQKRPYKRRTNFAPAVSV